MKKMTGFMKKTLFVLAVVLAAFSFFPETADAATIKINRKQITATAKECFTIKVSGVKGRKIEWFSTKKSVAMVSKNGVVVAKKAGKATIKAKVGKKTVKCNVTVKKNAKQPWLTVKEKTLHVGESFLLIEGWFTDYESVFSFNDRIATTNKHCWLDARDSKGNLLVIKNYREEGYAMCQVCGEKFLDTETLKAHRGTCFGGTMTAGGGNGSSFCKFNVSCGTYVGVTDQYCRLCGEFK